MAAVLLSRLWRVFPLIFLAVYFGGFPFAAAKDAAPTLHIHAPTGWTVERSKEAATSPLQDRILPDPSLPGLGDIRFYSQRVALPIGAGKSIETRVKDWIEADFTRLKHHIPTLSETTRYDMVMGDGEKALIIQLHGGEAGVYEAVAHRADGGGEYLFLVILTCRDEVSFIRALPWFRRIVGNSALITAAEGCKNDNPYDHLKLSLAMDAHKTWGQQPLENLKKITLPPGFEEGLHHTLPDVSPATKPLVLPDNILPQDKIAIQIAPIIQEAIDDANPPKPVQNMPLVPAFNGETQKPKTIEKQKKKSAPARKKKKNKRRRKKKNHPPLPLIRASFPVGQ